MRDYMDSPTQLTSGQAAMPHKKTIIFALLVNEHMADNPHDQCWPHNS